jgi:prolyl-tRNA synthetase
MLQSQLFSHTQKEASKDDVSVNACLLSRAGFIDKLSAGIYNFLPLGLRVLNKIVNIVREEMNAIAGEEILMPSLHPRSVWDVTGRWDVKEMFKLKSRSGKDFGLGWTHEEIITSLAKKFIFSRKDLPKYIYQIQTKMRDELRVKSGLLRLREFLMKDLYSFHESEKGLDEYYEKVAGAYLKIFERCGIRDKTYRTLALGGTFSKYSDEFQTIAEGGEDIIHICENCDRAINDEVFQPATLDINVAGCPDCGGREFKKEKSIEVGNIFKLGTGFSKPFNLVFKDRNGKENFIVMGCYGIGPSRLMGTIVEIFHDNKGIIWPIATAPFTVHLLKIKNQKSKIKNIDKFCNKLYNDLQEQRIEVLCDDREDVSAGEKFADADLIGIPYRVVVSEKTMKQNKIELKRRDSDKIIMANRDELIKKLKV